MVDEIAREVAITRYGMPASLHFPVAAVDEAAITNHVGEILRDVSGGGKRRAFLVAANAGPPREPQYPVWETAGCDVLDQQLQVWVDINYGAYRAAYRRAFPDQDISGQVLSHTINRRAATLKGYQFVRLTPTSRAANSSSAFSEGWGVTMYSDNRTPAERRRGASIQYADLTDLMLMLDIRLGGGVMDVVNVGQALIRPRPE